MTQDFPRDVKPIFSEELGAISPNDIPDSPIIIDSDSSSDFSPLDEICLEQTNEFDFSEVDREISLELGEIDPISSPPTGSSSQEHPQFQINSTNTTPDTTDNNPKLPTQEKGLSPKLCLPRPVVSQRTCATQTQDIDQSNTFQNRTHETINTTKNATKFTPHGMPRSKNRKYKFRREKIYFNRKQNKAVSADFKRKDMDRQPTVPLTPPNLPFMPLIPPNLPFMPLAPGMPRDTFQNPLSPLFTPNYAMAAAATLSAAALLQPFLQMPSGYLNIAQQMAAPHSVPPQKPLNSNTYSRAGLPLFPEGPSSTSDNLGHETTQRDTLPFSPATRFVPQSKRPKPTIKWRNSAPYREIGIETEIEPPSPAITTNTNPIPTFSLTHLRNQSVETVFPDTTIPTLKTQSCPESLFKLPSSQNSNSELSFDSSGDERLITYDANPTVAGGRRVIEFSDLAPNTSSETVEHLVRSIGPIQDFEFHQGLLYSRATVTYPIPKYALRCRRRFHMLCLDGVHISCNFAETEIGSILKLPET